MVTDAVGLLTYYEYVTSYRGTTYSDGYLNNGLSWWCITPYNTSNVRRIGNNGDAYNTYSYYGTGVRPAINLKSNVKIVDGDGTIDNPYRLEGDNDTNLSGTMLNTRYSGEYITFGIGENTLYRIVSHETSRITKIVSAEPLKSSGTFVTSALGNYLYSSTTTMGIFLNGEYTNNYVGNEYNDMIENSTTWYLGTVGSGESYKLAKYTSATSSTTTSSVTSAKVGLLRFGELMAGQFDRYENITSYWTLTPYSSTNTHYVSNTPGFNSDTPSTAYSVRPSMNLKSNVIITGGTGTKEDPFTIALQ